MTNAPTKEILSRLRRELYVLSERALAAERMVHTQLVFEGITPERARLLTTELRAMEEQVLAVAAILADIDPLLIAAGDPAAAPFDPNHLSVQRGIAERRRAAAELRARTGT